VNREDEGIRPVLDGGCRDCAGCLSICPGYSVDGNAATKASKATTKASRDLGSFSEIWEGYAADPEIRSKGSSGGILSALALYCLEREAMEFVLHTAADPGMPWLNQTVRSATRETLLNRTGSRYAPASPCDGLESIQAAGKPCVFIGKPCDVAAVNSLRQNRPGLDANIGIVLTFFCAGTPSTNGTLGLLKSFNLSKEEVGSLRYRGDGWPGEFKVVKKENGAEHCLPYSEAWSRLAKHTPLRCRLCPDGVGRVADISCGDAWHRTSNGTDPGWSVVIVRTSKGQDVIRKAAATGYVELIPLTPESVLAGQSRLLSKRKQLFGRLLALALMRRARPRFVNFSLFRSWLDIPLSAKVRSVGGTVRRCLARGVK